MEQVKTSKTKLSVEELIEKKEMEIKQKQNEKKKLQARLKEEERKKRTKRLIERGAILESYIEKADELTNEQIKEILQKAFNQSRGNETFSQVNQEQR